jgi:hypothetical protein
MCMAPRHAGDSRLVRPDKKFAIPTLEKRKAYKARESKIYRTRRVAGYCKNENNFKTIRQQV